MNIPGYRIEQEIGHGGMSTVYLAEQESLGRKVALKVMAPALAADRTFGERFLREGRTVAQLSHPNIPAVYDIGGAENSYYLAMEYLPCGDLKQRMRQVRMSPKEVLDVLMQIASALSYAHDKGFVHRDVKPENILFRENGTVVLSDFGIVKAIGSSTRMTGTGMSIGTPHYMSPEQARGKEIDGRSDLYSLGIVFFEMLTGRVPYEAEDSFAVAYAHINDPIPLLPESLAGLQPIIGRLMAKLPGDRFAAAGELAFEAERLRFDYISVHQGAVRSPRASETLVRPQISGGELAQTATVIRQQVPSDAKTQLLTVVIKAPDRFTDPTSGAEFILVKGGTFNMGDIWGDGKADAKPVHSVTLPDFYLGKYPVTQAEWQKIMGTNPSRFKDDRRPVENVSWDEVQTFIRRLNEKSGLSFRLPTEAEWEFACRSGGKDEKFSGGDDPHPVGWYDSSSERQTHSVGEKSANGLGFHDMSGNVWEWCEDHWHDDYQKAPTDGSAWLTGDAFFRVHRGGAWDNDYGWARSDYRENSYRTYRSHSIGFRLALSRI